MHGLTRRCVCENFGCNFAKRICCAFPNAFFTVGKKNSQLWNSRARPRFKIFKPSESKIPSGFGIIFEQPRQCRDDNFRFNAQVAKSIGSALAIEMVRVLQMAK